MPLADVSFDYDMSLIRDDQRAMLQKNADYLRRWTSVRVTIEGHADARGTNEYNMALGAARAKAVERALVALGVSSTRLDTISYGEEVPLDQGSDESAWAKNRRVHFAASQGGRR